MIGFPMVVEPLSEAMIAAGRQVLQATDRLGLDAEGAAWLYDHDDGVWEFFLVSSLVDEFGAALLYKKLLQAFTKIEFPKGMEILDIHLASPSDPRVVELSALAQPVKDQPALINKSSGKGMQPDGALYRMRSASSGPAARNALREFLRTVDELMAA